MAYSEDGVLVDAMEPFNLLVLGVQHRLPGELGLLRDVLPSKSGRILPRTVPVRVITTHTSVHGSPVTSHALPMHQKMGWVG